MPADARAIPPPSSSTPVQDKGAAYLAIVVTLGSIALLIFSLRVYTRGRLRRCFEIDDVFALLSAVWQRHSSLQS
jgi:hypothetical protein